MSLRATLASNLTVVETLTGPYVDPADATVTFDGMNETVILDGTTTPAVTKHADYKKALSSGAGTIDLTALPGKTADETVVGTGLKVQFAKFRNLSTNANPITITFGAANPYNLCGATFVIILAVGQSILIEGNAATPTIGSGAKNIDISGTGSQQLEVQIVMG